jgi:agmatine/peptidylarginine deiminase
LYDFTFNGWGQKFASEKDNNLTRLLFQKGAFDPSVRLQSFPFVLEGGSIEGNGEGVLLTTTRCLTEVHRNPGMNREGIDEWLKSCLGLKQILWLEEGYLAGDDTDGHIDMLARFCNPDTIAYVAPPEAEDEHAPALRRMEAAIKSWRTPSGAPYQLIPLPLPDPVYEGGERLPASYANFLIINGAVLVPTYRGSKDQLALELLQQAFPDRTVIGIDCLPLIRQHGSLHCLTMQYPVGFLRDDGI